jgi:hypothetical protein
MYLVALKAAKWRFLVPFDHLWDPRRDLSGIFRQSLEDEFSEVRSLVVSMGHNYREGSRATTARTERRFRVSDSEELARKERRRRLIERLNEKEKLLGPPSRARRAQMSEKELEAEIEKERVLQASRRGTIM